MSVFLVIVAIDMVEEDNHIRLLRPGLGLVLLLMGQVPNSVVSIQAPERVLLLENDLLIDGFGFQGF